MAITIKKNEVNMVYCPNCGEIVSASDYDCPHCRESLHNAIPVDTDEEKTKIKRKRKLERFKKRNRRIEKREAAFKKFPILRPLYYVALVALIVCVPVALFQLYQFSHLAGSLLSTAVFVLFYCWYVPILFDNMDDIVAAAHIPEGYPFSYKYEKNIRGSLWGLIILGGWIIIVLLSWVYECIPFGGN